MAFQVAAGWQNLPAGNFSPQIFSQKVQKFFRKESVVEAITNTDYYGEISEFGDTVYIIKEPTITVAPYARGTNVLPQFLADENLSLTVDQANYMAFKVDDIENKQSNVNWEDLATSSGAYSLKDTFDQEVLTYMLSQAPSANTYGTLGAALDVGFGSGEISPLSVLNRLSRLLDEQNIPSDNRWVVAPPVFWELAQDESSKLVGIDWQSSNGGESLLRNGKVLAGKIRGFEPYRSNNIPLDGSSQYQLLCGHMSSTATASQIAKVEKFRDPNSFADVVRGLHMYGRKTLRTIALGISHFTVD